MTLSMLEAGLVSVLAVSGVVGAVLTLAFLIVCLLMILIVLIQRPQGGGLSGAFGSGAGSGQTAFGAKTGDALTFATIGIFVVFVLGAIGLNFVARPSVPDQPAGIVAGEQTPADEAANAAAGGAETGSAATEDVQSEVAETPEAPAPQPEAATSGATPAAPDDTNEDDSASDDPNGGG